MCRPCPSVQDLKPRPLAKMAPTRVLIRFAHQPLRRKRHPAECFRFPSTAAPLHCVKEANSAMFELIEFS